MSWIPQIGPQLAALEADWCDEIFFGGERGGGKSDLQLGYQEDGALRYGKHSNGIMFRKTYPEMEELQARAVEIFSASGAIFRTQPSGNFPFSNCWYWPTGATVKMRYIENEKDYGRYHGHQYCVAEGTAIVMADGSHRPIEHVQVGDSVLTLEGPKKVLATIKPYTAECVRTTVFDSDANITGEQIHPIWHPLLTSVQDFLLSLAEQSGIAEQQQKYRLDPWQSFESLLCGCQDNQAYASLIEGVEIGCKVFEDERQATQRPQQLTVPVVLASQVAQSVSRALKPIQCYDACKSCKLRECLNRNFSESPEDQPQQTLRVPPSQDHVQPNAVHGGLSCELIESRKVQDSKVRCVADCRQDGVLSRYELKDGSNGVPSQDDAASQDHGDLQQDEKGCIRGHNHQGLYTYSHPYTKEQRPVVIQTELGKASIVPCGSYLVYDLMVEDANHYITSSGIVNKNTRISFDEVTEYPSPDGLLKMLSTLRSANGVPCSMRSTGNPGGIGHVWVKARYIDVAPPFTPYTDPETGFTRMFVPSKLSDNQILVRNDPNYRNRILAATAGNEALRKAWTEGAWDIVAGAFFSNWNHKAHVIEPVELPTNWTRFCSFDWGSSHPFSVGWWAVSDGTMNQFPAGALIRYREWYGMSRPNVGLKMSAPAVSVGIKERENETLAYRVADPAIFAENGGPSIAQSMLPMVWKPGDNKRQPGWTQLNDRLIGMDGRPMVYFFNTCVDTIRTLPAMQHDKHKIEDIDTDGEDHIADEIRYACMSRPWVRPQPEPPKGPTDRWEKAFDDEPENDWKTC